MAPRCLRFGSFELDEAGFELRKLGRPVPVQPKVLDLIVYLAKNRERVVTKEELFESVWRGVVVTEASLSQAISLARRALDDTPELEHSIRTIRSKGFRFVAEVDTGAEAPASAPVDSSVWSLTDPGSTALETAQEEASVALNEQAEPCLYLLLHCESPPAGGARYSLTDVDDVCIVRGSRRSSHRSSRTLTLVLPGRLLSREHARLVRTRDGWVLCDEGSKNGTFLNEKRVEKQALTSGDLIACGRTLLSFVEELAPAHAPDLDSRIDDTTLLTSVTPGLVRLGRDLERIAPSSLSVLLCGEAGTGKTHTARALHRASRRSGALVALDADTASGVVLEDELRRAHVGTLLLENVERWPAALLSRLLVGLESVQTDGAAVDARFVATSLLDASELEARLPRELWTRLSGYRARLPALRERVGDLGALVRALLASHHGCELQLDIAAGRRLVSHSWPGNIAELARCLEAAAALAAGSVVKSEHLPALASKPVASSERAL